LFVVSIKRPPALQPVCGSGQRQRGRADAQHHPRAAARWCGQSDLRLVIRHGVTPGTVPG
jgi:hypothetical protein